ncbi:hypothetical protein SERLADRAFT_478578, partial [Serpula lacrymans var. lacrymans S7.9]
MAFMSLSSWGEPSAGKRALLIHGVSSASQTWHRVAKSLAGQGYLVTAPDLPGHGTANRSSDYTLSAFADALRPLFASTRFDLVIGHSLGGL